VGGKWLRNHKNELSGGEKSYLGSGGGPVHRMSFPEKKKKEKNHQGGSEGGGKT